MSEVDKFTTRGAISLLRDLKVLFEVARFVDVSMMFQYDLNEAHTELVRTAYNCYAVWNKEHRCQNCVSATAFKTKGKMTKFEFIDKDIYYVVAKYIEIEDEPFMLEMVTKIDDRTLLGAFGHESFIKTIIGYNETLYIDPLTKAYNRQYFTTQLEGLTRANAIAFVDVDYFKEVNDTFGHDAGDTVLRAIVQTIMREVRSSDSVIRYGGDEFLVLFEKMHPDKFGDKLEQIRKSIEELSLPDYPEIKTSVSIGGVMCEKCDKDAIAAADKNLYEAKKTRNRAVC